MFHVSKNFHFDHTRPEAWSTFLTQLASSVRSGQVSEQHRQHLHLRSETADLGEICRSFIGNHWWVLLSSWSVAYCYLGEPSPSSPFSAACLARGAGSLSGLLALQHPSQAPRSARGSAPLCS